jgi:hypothetical protein
MADDPFQLYPVIAQIAAVFAGFGSLASGIRERRGGDDAIVDAYRLALMLFGSLLGTFLGLLPETLAGLAIGRHWAVVVSALLALVAIVTYAATSVSRVRKIRGVFGFSTTAAVTNAACGLTALIAFSLCALSIPSDRVADLYLLGLVALLGSSMVMFSRIIDSMLRPVSKGGKSDE